MNETNKPMKIYISGKITGEPIMECVRKFDDACRFVGGEYFDVVGYGINPLELEGMYFGISHDEAMRICLDALKDCTHAYFLRDWKESGGAKTEHQFCVDNNIKIIYE